MSSCVGIKYHAIELQKRVISRDWLFVSHVKANSSNALFFQSPDQRLLVYNLSLAHIDEFGNWFRQKQFSMSNDSLIFPEKGDANRDDIRFTGQFIRRNLASIQLGFNIRDQLYIVIEDARLKSLEPSGDFPGMFPTPTNPTVFSVTSNVSNPEIVTPLSLASRLITGHETF